ncbi:MAG: EamA family transporter RarD [Syntrophomonadaceae bacterium]|nr:EamA family transporter RarD [Syntrophomonadaceae bacterium]
MNLRQTNEQVKGIIFGFSAYALWGILPLYWKLLQSVSSTEILAHRVVWAFIFLLVILALTGKLSSFFKELQALLNQPPKLIGILMATILLNLNWFTYIWAVNHNHIVQSSLGYYINPLMSVLLGIFFLDERLSLWQVAAFILAALGVLSLTIQYGSFPWIAFFLAVTFAIYGLFKKVINIGSINGLTLETLLSFFGALPYLIYLCNTGNSAFQFNLSATTWLLIGAGAVTATPLLLFAAGTRRLPLFAIGFLQYVSPTTSLILGVLVFHEPFTAGHLLSFMVIWTSLIIFSLSRTSLFIKLEAKIALKRSVHLNQ